MSSVTLRVPASTNVEPFDRLDNALVLRSELQRSSLRRRRLIVWVARAVILGGGLGLWEWYGANSTYASFVFSTPTAILSTMRAWVTQGAFWNDVWLTTQVSGLGYLMAIVLALGLVAIVMAAPAIGKFLSPFLAALNALPKIVLFPLFIVWFGLTMKGRVYFVGTAIFFLIFYGVNAGLRSLDRDLIDNARMLGATRTQLVRTIYIPAIVTWLVTSLRVSAAMALLAAVVAEYLNGQGGLGYRIQVGRSLFKSDQVLAGILFVGFMALVVDRVLVRVQRRFDKWRVF